MCRGKSADTSGPGGVPSHMPNITRSRCFARLKSIQEPCNYRNLEASSGPGRAGMPGAVRAFSVLERSVSEDGTAKTYMPPASPVVTRPLTPGTAQYTS